jgi:uncharacterized membrane protein
MRIPASDRLVAVLGYLPFLFLVPMLGKRDSLFAQFHGRQSMVLWVLWLFACALCLAGIFAFGVGPSPWFFGLMFVATLVYLFYAVVGMLKSATRERYRMPIVADVALYVFRL